MIPLLGIVADLFPDIIKQLGGPLHEQSASVQDQVVEAIKKATNLQDPQTADPQAVKNQIQNSQQTTKDQLQNDLQQIALEELKERDRANVEAQRVELEHYRMDAEERERIREQEFQRQLLDFQDRQVARSTQMQLAEEHSPLAWIAPILAFVLVAMIWYLLHAILTARQQVINRDVFNVVLGALVTAFTTVVAYYFGSSLGSSRKDDALHNGRLTTNPNLTKPGSGDPGDDVPSASTTSPSPAPGETSGSATRMSKTTPIPTGVYGLFQAKAPGIMRNLIRDLGLSATQAAAILGNIGWECRGFKQLQEQNPVMGGRGGLGWCQWTASRRIDFEKWLAQQGVNYQDDDANYGFLLKELRTTQSPSISSIRSAGDIATATSEFMRVFERPAARYAHLEGRIVFAKLAFQAYGRAFNV
jgi:Phage tail lysozyme